MALLFEHLDKAFANFEKAMFQLDKLEPSDPLYDLIRSALIQSFEYTWDAFVKAVTRCLIEDLANPAKVEEMSYKQQMIEAQKKGYITDVEAWLKYRSLRNKTSHEYFEQHAVEVAENAREFYQEVKHCKEVMKENHEDLSL
jgi:nucleotidyltransferase substrate binding protein (TIGR01987 family)